MTPNTVPTAKLTRSMLYDGTSLLTLGEARPQFAFIREVVCSDPRVPELPVQIRALLLGFRWH